MTKTTFAFLLMFAIIGQGTAGAAEKWLKCTLTEGFMGSKPWSPKNEVRVLAFDEGNKTFTEYLAGTKRVGTVLNMNDTLIQARVEDRLYHIERLSGAIQIHLGQGSGADKGSCVLGDKPGVL
jgi:hypothetical protein